jgi:hypothetical protein
MLGYHWPSALEETVLPFFCGLFNHIASGQPASAAEAFFC